MRVGVVTYPFLKGKEMQKAEFIITEKELKNQIEVLSNKIKQVKLDYIKCNSLFSIGEKVKVIGKNERHAFISEVRVSYFNDIEYVILKEKKDGTPSLVRDFKWSGETIVKV